MVYNVFWQSKNKNDDHEGKGENVMKKRNLRRPLTAMMLAAAMTVAFTGCSKNKEDKRTSTTAARSEYVYQPTFSDIDMDADYISGSCIMDGKVYMLGSKWDQKDERETQYFITCASDGSDLQQNTFKGMKKNEYVSVFTQDEEGKLRVLSQVSDYNEKTGESKETYYVHTLNEKGKITDTVELQRKKKKSQEDYFYVNRNGVAFSGGKLYVVSETKIYCFDENGKEEKVYQDDNNNYIDSIVAASDGKLYVFGYEGEKYALREFDPATGNFGKTLDFGDYSIYNANMSAGEGSILYINDMNNVYTFDLSTGKLNTEFNWLNSDVDGNNISSFFQLEPGKFMAVSTAYDDSTQKNNLEIVTMNKVKSSDVKEKQILTLSCSYLDYNVKAKVLDFNKKNETYRIEVKDYSNYEDGPKQMNLDITSGNIPDIMDVSSVPKDQYIKKGILTDLYPMMEKDTEVTKESFIPSVLKTIEKDGKLYYMGTSFSIQGLAASKKIMGDKEGWTVDDMMKLYEEMPEDGVFMQYMTRQWFLQNIISYQMKDYINWSTGEVRFDSEDFVKLIEFSKNFPDEEQMDYDNMEDTPTMVKKGKLMLNQLSMYDLSEFQSYSQMYKKQGGFTVLSYPSSDANNSLPINMDGAAFAITEQCADKEGAWEFLRQFFTYEYQKPNNIYNFPTRQDALDKKLEYAMATEAYTDEDGTEVVPLDSSYGYGSMDVKIGPLTQEEADLVRGLIDRIGIMLSYDTTIQDISEIISEEMKAFFAGDKTAKDTADVIQSRVKIYVSENS